MSAYDPSLVKTHTIAKCRKYNSPTRYRTYVRGARFDSVVRNFFEMFLRAQPTKTGLKSRNAAVSGNAEVCYSFVGST